MGCSEMELTSELPESIAALKAQILLPDGQSLACFAIAQSLLVAVNQQMVGDETLLNSEDEVAFFPPVTGG